MSGVVGRLAAWLAGRSLVQLFLLASLAAVVIHATAIAVLPRRYGHIVSGDGLHYYVYLRSLVHDGNLDFTDEYTEFNRAITDPTKRINIGIRTATGLVLNQFSVGPALLAAPLYLVAHGLSLAGRALGLPVRVDGYGLLYEGSYALTGVLSGVAAGAVTYAALRRLLPVGPALGGVAATWLGGSLLYYTIASPTYAHAASALGVAAWLWAWTRLDPRRAIHWLGLGLLGGLMATMRWQEALCSLLPMVCWLIDQLRGQPATAGRLLAAESASPVTRQPALATALTTRYGTPLLTPLAYGLGLLVGFLPQMLAWTALFGGPLAVPQTGYFFTWTEPHWLDVLFSTRNGLFTWTPVALIGVIGLVVLLRAQPRWAMVGLSALLLQVLLNGILQDWWGGAAFGARRFLGMSAFLALGCGWLLYRLWTSYRRPAIAVLAGLILLNGLLIVHYTAFLRGLATFDTMPTLSQMTVERFTWPLGLLSRGRE